MLFIKRKGTLVLLWAMLLSLVGWPSASAQAQSGERCFVETGNCISGAIRAYWERNGGLAIFGYPLSAQHIETVEGSWTGPVQLFERDRLEDHSNQGLGVLAGRLGAQLLAEQGRPWQSFNAEPPAKTAECRYFPETKHNTCAQFLRYWERNGGLARFGYPITTVIDEVIEGRTYKVQYFERRRMELHPEHAGTAYEVLLGLLGREVVGGPLPVEACPGIPTYLRRTWEIYTQDLGCGQPYGDGRLAIQQFESGQMIWVGRSDGSPGQIFVITGDPSFSASWSLVIDSYVEGEPVGTSELPPPGRYAPVRGFGKLWRTNPQVRQALGWATTPEQAANAVIWQFVSQSGLNWMIGNTATNRVTILRVDPAGQRAVELLRQS